MTSIRQNQSFDDSSVSSSSSSSSSGSSELGGILNDDQNEHLDAEDRIRAQLLQSFYGSSAPPTTTTTSTQALLGNNNENRNHVEISDTSNAIDGNTTEAAGGGTINDPNYDAHAHVHSLLKSMSTDQLLVKNEDWTREIRSLDSTMQTLVYENYQKFIHATEAVTSIGSSVNGSQQALSELTQSMSAVEEKTIRIEEQLKDSRRAIAEKLRVKTQLESLQSILKLPQTLYAYIGKKEYKEACRCAESATRTLSNDSFRSFESLRRIQDECHDIMRRLVKDLQVKLNSWSSPAALLGMDHRPLFMLPLNEKNGTTVDPPESISEIYECVSALQTVIGHPDALLLGKSDEDDADAVLEDTQSPGTDCQTKALKAFQNYLQKELSAENGNKDSFLAGLIEGITFYGKIYAVTDQETGEAPDNDDLFEFAEDAISNYLSRVHYKSSQLQKGEGETSESTDGFNNAEEYTKALIDAREFVEKLEDALLMADANASKTRISSLCSKFTSSISSVVEMSVKKNVQNEFAKLGQRSKKRLDDFLTGIRRDGANEGVNADKMRHFARVAVVDFAEAAEGVIANLSTVLKSMPMSKENLEQAVVNGAREFVAWLSVSLEIVAGCEDAACSSDVVRVGSSSIENTGHTNAASGNSVNVISLVPTNGKDDECLWQYPEPMDFTALSPSDPSSENSAHFFLIIMLVVADMCRLAEQIIIPAINESIAFMFMECDEKTNAGYFESENVMKTSINADGAVTKAFREATSRILLQYCCFWANAAISVGFSDGLNTAAVELNTSWFSKEDMADPSTLQPRPAVFRMLEFVKESASIFTAVFGEPTKFGHVPTSREVALMPYQYRRANLIKNSTSRFDGGQILLDVERMLASKTPVYGSVDVSLDSLITTVLKIIFKAFSEFARNCYFFSEVGYQQLEVDALFLRVIVPHYVVNHHFHAELEHLLDDVLVNAAERCCFDHDLRDSDSLFYITDAVCRLLDEGDALHNLLLRKRRAGDMTSN